MSAAATMRAVRLHAPGGAEAMVEERIPAPVPGILQYMKEQAERGR